MSNYSSALEDFRKARSRADWSSILARLRGASNELLSYDEVLKQLKLRGGAERGLKDIPLHAIVGSVGRCTDFTRDFLPRTDSNSERWARVKEAFSEMAGVPPIEVYQIGEVYFVKDGNHRVSVARELGASLIQAYVTEVKTRVPLTPGVTPDDLIMKSEYANFLEKTSLDELRPEADLTTTVCGQYPRFEEHIDVHRYFMGIDFGRQISYEEAVTHWYDTVYLPVIQVIREQGLLASFPNRTEADLYLWMAEHRASLEEEVGFPVRTEAAAKDLITQHSPRPFRTLARLSEKLLQTISLDRFEAGPPPGKWREEKGVSDHHPSLFEEVLVAISGDESGWSALDQALILADREGSRIHGLHVVPSEDQMEGVRADEIRWLFQERCARAGQNGQIGFVIGDVSRQICSRGRWSDLIVARLNNPPPEQPLARLGHGFRDLFQRCPTPILAVPQQITALQHALLAFDGSRKAEEALYIAAYLAGKWGTKLTVVTVQEGPSTSPETLDQARLYLEAHEIEAQYRLESAPPALALLRTAQEENCDFFLMGGYGYSPLVEVVMGSLVDEVSRQSTLPLLICR